MVAKAFPRAMTVENITSGFKVTGIFPHNTDVFPEEAFLPAQVTYRPQPDDQVLTAATADSATIAASASVGAPDSSHVMSLAITDVTLTSDSYTSLMQTDTGVSTASDNDCPQCQTTVDHNIITVRDRTVQIKLDRPIQ